MRAPARSAAAALVLLGLLALPVAAPARERLAYEHDSRIYSIDASGSGRVLLAGSAKRGSRYAYRQPAWSPSGSALAFTRERAGDSRFSQIQLRAGGTIRSLTPLVRDQEAMSPAFSRDGRTLAYVQEDGDDSNTVRRLVTVPVAGGTPRVVASQPVGDAIATLDSPAWTPDGRIAYTVVRYDDGTNETSRVYTVRPDGSDRRELLRDAFTPAWSADGARMAFASTRDRNGQTCDGDLCAYRSELYLAAADGTARRRLTRNEGDDTAPSWSADGSRILFSSTRNFPERTAASELYTITPAGTCLSWLTNGVPLSADGAWQPGTGTGADAGGCGALGRQPLLETARGGGPGLWLGRSYRGLLLTDVGGLGRGEGPAFAYDDCGAFDARDCLPPVELYEQPVCRTESFVALRERRGASVRRYRGAVLAKARQDPAEVYSGAVDTSVGVEGERRADRAVVLRGLRAFGAKAGSRLPAPRVSRRTARILRAAVRAYRAGSRTAKVRKRVRMARALAPLRTTRCD